MPRPYAAYLLSLAGLACSSPEPDTTGATPAVGAEPVAAILPEPEPEPEPAVEAAATSEASGADPATSDGTPWTLAWTPPPPPRTDRLRLEVLGPAWAELDYEALMGSRDHLRRTLQWGSWPRANFTLEENRADLVRHLEEYERREAFAYTVLDPDGEECLGCIYLNPARGEERSAMLALWVVEPELEFGLDDHLLHTVVAWLEEEWPLDRLFILLHEDNTRGVEIARAAGFTTADWQEPNHVILEHPLE